VIRLNGSESTLEAGVTVAAVLESLGLESDARGVAVAVDGEVIARSDWPSFPIAADARVEVVTAMQGG
jgi:sulfur carrier protein